MLLRLASELHDQSGHAAIDAIFLTAKTRASTTVDGRITRER
jgi:hypothetical protein